MKERYEKMLYFKHKSYIDIISIAQVNNYPLWFQYHKIEKMWYFKSYKTKKQLKNIFFNPLIKVETVSKKLWLNNANEEKSQS